MFCTCNDDNVHLLAWIEIEVFQLMDFGGTLRRKANIYKKLSNEGRHQNITLYTPVDGRRRRMHGKLQNFPDCDTLSCNTCTYIVQSQFREFVRKVFYPIGNTFFREAPLNMLRILASRYQASSSMAALYISASAPVFLSMLENV